MAEVMKKNSFLIRIVLVSQFERERPLQISFLQALISYLQNSSLINSKLKSLLIFMKSILVLFLVTPTSSVLYLLLSISSFCAFKEVKALSS